MTDWLARPRRPVDIELPLGLVVLICVLFFGAGTLVHMPDVRAGDMMQMATSSGWLDALQSKDSTACVLSVTVWKGLPGEVGIGFIGGYTAWQETPDLRQALRGKIGMVEP